MDKKSIRKVLLTAVSAAVLFMVFFVCAWAVPARPGSGYEGADAVCRSHTGELVRMENIPVRRGRGAHFAPSVSPANRSIPLLTIVIGFTNMPYENEWDWHEAIFSGEKSIASYYSDMSFGKFTFTPAAETASFGVGGNTNTADRAYDGVVHVNLSVPHKDWAGDDEYKTMISAFVAAIEKSNAYVDYASFDVDGNGAITENELAIAFIVAGYEGSATSTYEMGEDKYLWAHAYSIGDCIEEYGMSVSIPTPDGTLVSEYIAIAEHLDETERNPISVLAHELGHYIGLPDLYDTLDYSSSRWNKYDVSSLSLMSSGSWGVDPDGGYIPYSLDVWSRYALGWCTPQTADHDGTYAVTAQSYSSPDAFTALYLPTQRAGEYYLLENRQFTKWDAGLAEEYDNSGILLWHIDDAVFEKYHDGNTVNDTNHRPAVMPLYPERKSGAYTFIGLTDKVFLSKPFFDSAVWDEMFGASQMLDLPLYGEGSNADNRSKRTLSGLKLSFQDASAAEMHIRLFTGDHVHFFTHYRYNDDATYEADGTETAFCDYGCGAQDTRTAANTKRIALDEAYVTIDDGIGVHFLLSLDDASRAGLENIRVMHRNFNGETVTETYAKSALPRQSDGKYKLTVRIAPAQLADRICVTLGETMILQSVLDYCETLNAMDDVSPAVKNVAQALEQYAQAANTFFAYTDTCIADISALSAADGFGEWSDRFVDHTGMIDSISFLALEKPEFRFYTPELSEADAAACTVSVSFTDGTTGDLQARFARNTQNEVFLEVTGLCAEDLGRTVAVTVSGYGTIEFAGYDFAKRMAESADADTAALGIALYNYGAAANACFSA